MKNKRGITLIALVITIIILLILAGITITQLINNGLFENTKLAKEKWEKEQNKENSILDNYENEINTYVNSIRDAEDSPKKFTILDTDRAEYNIPQGVKLAYIFISRGTTNIPYTISINSPLITSSECVSSTKRDDVGLAVYIDIYKVNLSGEIGKINLFKSADGSAKGQAWNACIIF